MVISVQKMYIKGMSSYLYLTVSKGKIFASTLFPINDSFLSLIRFSLSDFEVNAERKHFVRGAEGKDVPIFTERQQKKVMERCTLMASMKDQNEKVCSSSFIDNNNFSEVLELKTVEKSGNSNKNKVNK